MSGVLWGIEDGAGFDPAKRWAEGGAGPVVRVGVREDGAPVALDLREGAEGGAGPHALVVGATGSGKSELLRTLVLGLAVHNPPEELALLLVDHHGGASFAAFAGLPHVAGLAVNLWEPGDVPRLEAVLHGELRRRQELFREAGVGDIGRYRAAGFSLPRLVAVFEEFSELLAARPEFLATLLTAARIGRSLGIHLVLASQRLEPGRLRGLDAHLSCRVALRTFSAAESRAAIDGPDAYDLPRAPGHALLRDGPAAPAPFRVEYVPPPRLEELAGRVAAAGGATRPLWRPRLEGELPLAAVLGEPREDPRRGRSVGPVLRGERLLVPVGVVDLPHEHAQRPFAVDLRGGAGHVAVVGSPGSGRRTTLVTLMRALALLQTPEEIQIFAITHREPPGVPLAGWARPADADAVRDVAARVRGLMHAANRRALLVVEDLTPAITDRLDDVVHEGSRLGVHLAASAERWAAFGPVARLDAFRQRVELRLADPAASAIDRRAAAELSFCPPGHGLTTGGHRVLIARG